MDKLTNQELIEKYGDVFTEQYRLFKELFTRHQNGELSESEWADVQNVAKIYTSRLFDNFLPCGISNESVRDGICEALKEINDVNR